MMYTFETRTTNVLIIGASGRTGNYIVEALAAQSNDTDNSTKVNISAFARKPDSLDPSISALCANVIQGDARNSKDIDRALKFSNADIVVVSVGNGDNVGKSDIRTSSAQALTDVLQKRRFQHVKVLVVSSIGAGKSRIKAGFGIGRLIEYHLRHILNDHNGQEAAFLSNPSIENRTMILRPTGLTEGESPDHGKMVSFDDHEKCPTMKTDRKDLAEFAAKQMLFEETIRFGAKPMNITVVKQ